MQRHSVLLALLQRHGYSVDWRRGRGRRGRRQARGCEGGACSVSPPPLSSAVFFDAASTPFSRARAAFESRVDPNNKEAMSLLEARAEPRRCMVEATPVVSAPALAASLRAAVSRR